MGALIDLFTLGGQVESRNTSEELKTIRANALSNSSKGIIGVVAMFVLFASCQKPDVVISECQKNAEEMLLPVAYQGENEVESCFALGAFQLFRTLTAPVTIADMKAALELNLNTAFTQDSFDVVLGTISSLPWDSSSLTTADISLINEIRSHLNPNPVFTACGGTSYPALDSDITVNHQPFLNAPNWRHACTVELSGGVFSCQIEDVRFVNIVSSQNNAMPATFICTPVAIQNNNRVFAFYHNEWLSDPAATSTQYTSDIEFRDSSGVVLSTISGYLYSF